MVRHLSLSAREPGGAMVAPMTTTTLAARQLAPFEEPPKMAATESQADQPGQSPPSGLVLAADAARTRTDQEHGSTARQPEDDLPMANRSRKGIPLVRQTSPLANQCHRVQSNASLLDAVSGRVQLALPMPVSVLGWPSHPTTSKRKASSTGVQADPPSRRPRLLGPKQLDVPQRLDPSLAKEQLRWSLLPPLVQPWLHR